MGPRMAPSQYHSLMEWPRRPAIQPERKVNTASRRSATAKPIMGFPVEYIIMQTEIMQTER